MFLELSESRSAIIREAFFASQNCPGGKNEKSNYDSRIVPLSDFERHMHGGTGFDKIDQTDATSKEDSRWRVQR